jgi:Fungal chitosanase of glycosyl hydrolase group 75
VLIALTLFLTGPKIETIRFLPSRKRKLTVALRRIENTTALFFQSKMSCDVDGAPNAYHPLDDRKALDVISSASGRRSSNAPDSPLVVQPSPDIVAFKDGKPYVQETGLFAGYYVSKTSLQNERLAETDPTRYLDPRSIQFIVLPGNQVPEANLGDLVAVLDPLTSKVAFGVYGDIGPSTESGEASLAMIQRLGFDAKDGKSSPTEDRKDILFVVFPGTAKKVFGSWPLKQTIIDQLAIPLWNQWPGRTLLLNKTRSMSFPLPQDSNQHIK